MKKQRKTGENKIEKIGGALMSYLLAIVAVLIFALFCSGRVGWFLLMVVIGAPLLSLIWTLICSKFVAFEPVSNARILEKGTKAKLEIRFFNKSILPIPSIEVWLKNDNHVSIENDKFVLYSVFPGEKSISTNIYTMFAGKTDIFIEKVIVSDFFGVFRFDINKNRKKKNDIDKALVEKVIPNKTTFTIGIYPATNQLEEEKDWLLEAKSSAFDGEEPDTTVDDRSVTFGGFPGFEHREYIPGDPIKRINYKLSARTGKYQVRLDEQQAVAEISLYLSNLLPEDLSEDAKYVSDTSRCLEQLMGVAMYLYAQEFAVRIYLPGAESFILTDRASILQLRNQLAMTGFSKEYTLDDTLSKEGAGSIIAFVSYREEQTMKLLEDVTSREGNHVTTYISSLDKGGVYEK